VSRYDGESIAKARICESHTSALLDSNVLVMIRDRSGRQQMSTCLGLGRILSRLAPGAVSQVDTGQPEQPRNRRRVAPYQLSGQMRMAGLGARRVCFSWWSLLHGAMRASDQQWPIRVPIHGAKLRHLCAGNLPKRSGPFSSFDCNGPPPQTKGTLLSEAEISGDLPRRCRLLNETPTSVVVIPPPKVRKTGVVITVSVRSRNSNTAQHRSSCSRHEPDGLEAPQWVCVRLVASQKWQKWQMAWRGRPR
jgi:hypothetical protein